MSEIQSPPSPFARREVHADGTTLRFERRLPGPLSRVWSHLADGALRARWLAAGELPAEVGQPFELVWRNDELSESPAQRPAGFPEVSRATCVLRAIEPPRRLAFDWPEVGEVTIELAPADDGEVLLTLTHRSVADRPMRLMVGAGWHTHLDILAARLRAEPAPSFWTTWQALRQVYDERLG